MKFSPADFINAELEGCQDSPLAAASQLQTRLVLQAQELSEQLEKDAQELLHQMPRWNHALAAFKSRLTQLETDLAVLNVPSISTED